MGIFKNSSDNKGKWDLNNLEGLTVVDSGLRGVVLNFVDFQQMNGLSSDEKQALADIKRGKKEIKLSRSQQSALIRKAKKEEARVKALAKNKKK